MNIRINGREESVGKILNIECLIREKGLSPDKIVVEYNRRIAAKEEWPHITVREGDAIEIISFVGGG